MRIKDLIARIPYLRLHSVQTDCDGPALRIRLPFREEMQNHVGTLHAGALFTVAETAAGAAAYGIIPGGKAYVLLKSSTVRYLRRASSEVVAEARVKTRSARRALQEFMESRRSDVRVQVTVLDREDEKVLEGMFHYALRPGGVETEAGPHGRKAG